MPEASRAVALPGRVPPQLIEDLGSPGRDTRRERAAGRSGGDHDFGSTHYAYEDEDQRPRDGNSTAEEDYLHRPSYNSIDNIAEFFASRGKKFSRPKVEIAARRKRGSARGTRRSIPSTAKGRSSDAKATARTPRLPSSFHRFGLKKLVEKYAQLESC